MNIDIIIEARLSSTRLPGKVLRSINGFKMLELQLLRLSRSRNASRIIVASGDSECDDPIEALCKKLGVECFRGSENDVVERLYQCTQFYETDIIVEITGDNPLSDSRIVDFCITEFLNEPQLDFMSTDLGWYNPIYKKEYPIGLSVKMFSKQVMDRIHNEASISMDREHVVNYILQNTDEFSIGGFSCLQGLNRPDLRLTVDYPEDFELISHIYNFFKGRETSVSGVEICAYLDNHPTVSNINSQVKQKNYQR